MMKNNIDILDLKNDILNIIGDCMKQDNINDEEGKIILMKQIYHRSFLR
jgi:hypothetical protein